MFSISNQLINAEELHARLSTNQAGAIVVFEGRVRNHNEGKEVSSLEYQVYHELAVKEGQRILAEAQQKFNLHGLICVHREGHLKLGEVAIWIGASSSHRDDAFKASRYVIDEVKHRLPVWKKEHYVNQPAEWVFCRHHHHHVHFTEADYYQKQQKLVDQDKLKKSRVLVVGAGGLGCPALVSLASAGVGHLTIVDPDKISISNIHRQFLYSPNLVGEMKAVVAAHRLQELNPFIKLEVIADYFQAHHLHDFDLVLDCTDNMDTKYFIHDVCFNKKTPLISAGVYKYEGQLRTFSPAQGCLRCHGNERPDDSLLGNCNDFGVVGATTAALGAMQASEAITFLLKEENESLKSTFLFNLEDLSVLKIKNTARKDCPTCLGVVEVLESDLEVNHIEGADLVDIRNIQEVDPAEFPANKKIVLACHRGIRSKTLALKFRQQGFQNIYSLRGGLGAHL